VGYVSYACNEAFLKCLQTKHCPHPAVLPGVLLLLLFLLLLLASSSRMTVCFDVLKQNSVPKLKQMRLEV